MGLFSSEQKEVAIMLTEEDFKCLVRGGVLTINKHLKIALQDIGFHTMEAAIETARNRINTYVGRDREKEQNK